MATESKTRRLISSKGLAVIAAIIFSGSCWYLSNGLTGDYWYLLWFAPIPILVISFRVSGWKSFFIAFIAYTLGRLVWLEYALSVIPVLGAIVFTVFFSLFFALVIALTRKIVIHKPHWISVFGFPALWTSFEFLFFKLSPHGTAGSIAYSQSDFLPVVQIASLTGISGITFLASFFPSAISTVWFYRKNRRVATQVSVISFLILLSAFIFGEYRMHSASKENEMTVGMAAIDEKYYDDKYYEQNGSNPEMEMEIVDLYNQQISALANEGAKIILLPEKIVTANPLVDSAITKSLREAAVRNKVAVITSYTRVKDSTYENAGFAVSPEGKPLTDYMKVKLFEWEAATGFIAGEQPGKPYYYSG